MATRKEQTSDCIERRAVNASGRLGSLYDVCRDQIIERSTKHFPEQHSGISEPIHCEIIKGNIGKHEDLLRYIGMEDELILSLMLKSTKRDGIGTILNDSCPIDDCIRFFYFRCKENRYDLQTIPKLNDITESDNPGCSATHIVTSIVMGIEVIVVLRLPYDINLKNEIDSLLITYVDKLSRNEGNIIKILPGHKKILTKIVRTKIYSNIPNLNKYTLFPNIIDQISANKRQGTSVCHPLSYILQSIESLYPKIMSRSMMHRPLSDNLRKKLEKHISQSRNIVMCVESFRKAKVSKSSTKSIQPIFNEIRRQCEQFENGYKEEIQRLLKLVVDARNGATTISVISDFLSDEQVFFKNSIYNIYETLSQYPLKDDSIYNLQEKLKEYLQTIERSINQIRASTKASNENNPPRFIHESSSSIEKNNNEFMASSTIMESVQSSTHNNKSTRSTSDQKQHNRSSLLPRKYSSNNYSPTFSSLSSTISLTQHNSLDESTYSTNSSGKNQQQPIDYSQSMIHQNENKHNSSTPKSNYQGSSSKTKTKLKKESNELQSQHDSSSTSFPSHPILLSNDTRSKNEISLSTSSYNEKNQISSTEDNNNSVPKHEQKHDEVLVNTDFEDSVSMNGTMNSESHESVHNEECLENTSYSPENYSSADDTINVLLVGETGVGKSTFVNAFVNYLTFASFEEAESSEPIVLIPVSFIMSVGDNFEERKIKFGEVENPDNENFNDSGQSVTQHCKSYIFDLKQSGKKLRIIDTPGFGDTRGLEQDDYNMEHILQYINNLTHLNTICFLLKPNSSRRNMLFRMCFTELFSFLSPDARKNVIFCFTNGRSTFYTPGDTAPLLKQMLKSSSVQDIPFRKENTFCFDSESFRYLVALRNNITFTGVDRGEYEKSWLISVKESNRFISYINDNLSVYHMNNGWQSIRNAHFQVLYIIRPILETIRNILRNMILYKNNLANEFIQLHATSTYHTDTYCLFCKGDMELVGRFWILYTIPHDIQDGICSCSCPAEKHVPLNYVLDYECVQAASDSKKNSSNELLEILRDVCVDFARFLTQTHHGTKDDPFFYGLKRMIEEEAYICKNKRKETDLNKQLLQVLTNIKDHHERRMNKENEKQTCMELPDIYDLIKRISKHPLVRQQMLAVRGTQRTMMEQYEYEPQKI